MDSSMPRKIPAPTQPRSVTRNRVGGSRYNSCRIVASEDELMSIELIGDEFNLNVEM